MAGLKRESSTGATGGKKDEPVDTERDIRKLQYGKQKKRSILKN